MGHPTARFLAPIEAETPTCPERRMKKTSLLPGQRRGKPCLEADWAEIRDMGKHQDCGDSQQHKHPNLPIGLYILSIVVHLTIPILTICLLHA